MNMAENSLSKQYQRKSDKQHILDNPDTYIGSVENVDATMWVYDDATSRIVHKTIEYIPDPDKKYTPQRCWLNLRSQHQKAFEAFAEQIDLLEIKHPLTCQI